MLADGDLSVFPSRAKAGQGGDFTVEFIRHPMDAEDQDIYLSIGHKDSKNQEDYGPVNIPLDVGRLMARYPDATIEGRHIHIGHIILTGKLDSVAAHPGSKTELTQQQREGYSAAAKNYPTPDQQSPDEGQKQLNTAVGGILQ